MARKIGAAVAAIAAALSACASPSTASLLGTDWSLGNNSSLYTINTSTRQASKIGDTGLFKLIGLVVDADSAIYAVSEESSTRLWKLNPQSAAPSLVGALSFRLSEGDMTIDPDTGKLYVSSSRVVSGEGLYLIDKTNASSTLIGNYGPLGRDISGLQFIGGTLYAIVLNDDDPDTLVKINPNDASITVVGPTTTNFGTIAAMGRDPETNTVFIAGPTTPFGNDNLLYTLNLATAAATLAGPLTGVTASISGFSVAGNPQILLAPEPSTALLLSLLITLPGLAKLLTAQRRRHRE